MKNKAMKNSSVQLKGGSCQQELSRQPEKQQPEQSQKLQRTHSSKGDQPMSGNQQAAAYIRFSKVTFPDGCITEDAQNAFLLELTAVRRLELRQLAAGQGQSVHVWYEDLGRSGRGKFLSSRVQFEALTVAARAGKLRSIFAWDLSRLFRDLVQQELWLEEMEKLGVSVHIQDLPIAVDAPTRRLLRQELGMISEYEADRIGALFSATLNTQVGLGLWVGRTYSQWGLRYDPQSKGFLLDEATAPYIRRLYTLFNSLGGSASQTVRTLNWQLQAGHPEALRPPRSRCWDVTKLLKQIRDPLYRRRTCYKDTEYPAAHLVPEVISPEVVAETDALLAARQLVYEKCASRLVTPPDPYLYSRRLRCAECGEVMQACPRQVASGPVPGLHVLWTCSDALRGGLCTAGFSVPQYCLNALLDRGLREAFAAQRELFLAKEQRAEKQRAEKQRAEKQRFGDNVLACGGDGLADSDAVLTLGDNDHQQRQKHRKAIRAAKRARGRCLENYATGLTDDRQHIKDRLAVLEARQACAEEALSRLPPVRARATPEGRWTWSKVGRLEARFEAIWPQDWWQVRDPAKTALLRDLDLTIWLHIAPKEPVVLKEPVMPVEHIAQSGQEPADDANSIRLALAAPPHEPLLGEQVVKAPRVRGKRPYKPRRTRGLCTLKLCSSFFEPGELSTLSLPDSQGPSNFLTPPSNFQAPPSEFSEPLLRSSAAQGLRAANWEAGKQKAFTVQETWQELLDYKLLLRPRRLTQN